MHTKIILKVLGILLMVFSLTLIPPIIIGLIYQDGGTDTFVKVMIVNLLIGTFLWYPLRYQHRDLKIRDGIIIVVIFWVGLGTVASFPFLIESKNTLSFTHAMFESISGLTTTGATVMSNLDHMPHAILWYRQQLQWLGGMGLIVLSVAILPIHYGSFM
jgi:trk system potassium uptake protein TrkH